MSDEEPINIDYEKNKATSEDIKRGNVVSVGLNEYLELINKPKQKKKLTLIDGYVVEL